MNDLLTRRTFAALAVAAIIPLAACAPYSAPDAVVPPPAGAYLAVGTEPGWTLEITANQLAYAGDYGAKRITVANPGARPSSGGSRIVTDRLVVDITRTPCSDGMSDRRYSDTVSVTADGQRVRGCGGAILPPADLAGTNWRMTTLNGAAIDAGRGAELRFDGTRLSGSAGCNRFSGNYRVDAARLIAGPLMSTRMACPGALGEQERAVLAMLAGPVALRFPSSGRLVLTGEGGAVLILDRVI